MAGLCAVLSFLARLLSIISKLLTGVQQTDIRAAFLSSIEPVSEFCA